MTKTLFDRDHFQAAKQAPEKKTPPFTKAAILPWPRLEKSARKEKRGREGGGQKNPPYIIAFFVARECFVQQLAGLPPSKNCWCRKEEEEEVQARDSKEEEGRDWRAIKNDHILFAYESIFYFSFTTHKLNVS